MQYKFVLAAAALLCGAALCASAKLDVQASRVVDNVRPPCYFVVLPAYMRSSAILLPASELLYRSSQANPSLVHYSRLAVAHFGAIQR